MVVLTGFFFFTNKVSESDSQKDRVDYILTGKTQHNQIWKSIQY